MNKKIVLGLMACVILIGYVGYNIIENNIQQEDIMEKELYQGPVPEGYDEKHFRETGKTILEVSNG